MAEVLARRKLAKAVKATGLTPAVLLRDYQEFTHLVVPKRTRRVVPRDPDDDHVIACAIAARAALVVTGDRDLLQLETHRGIRIVRAAEALELIIV